LNSELIIVTSAWWVSYDQILKREGTHEVRGKKNFLPPAMLVLGYGILWSTEDEETQKRHARKLGYVIDSAEQAEGEVGAEMVEVEATDEMGEKVATIQNSDDDDDDDAAIHGDKDDQVEDPESQDDDNKDDKDNVAEDKYNLNQYGSASEEEQDIPSASQSQSTTITQSHPRLSAKQRRDLKKGLQTPPLPTPRQDSDSEVDELASSIATTSVSKKQTPLPRGKKGKMKKAKTKYAEQSGEERELARKLLGGKGATQVKEQKATSPKHTKSDTATATGVKPAQTARTSPALPPKPIVDEPLEVYPPLPATPCLPYPLFLSLDCRAQPLPSSYLDDCSY
jgi:hypothetical protein